jgi:hypothetical protein
MASERSYTTAPCRNASGRAIDSCSCGGELRLVSVRSRTATANCQPNQGTKASHWIRPPHALAAFPGR